MNEDLMTILYRASADFRSLQGLDLRFKYTLNGLFHLTDSLIRNFAEAMFILSTTADPQVLMSAMKHYGENIETMSFVLKGYLIDARRENLREWPSISVYRQTSSAFASRMLRESSNPLLAGYVEQAQRIANIDP
ncbi:hypothetical protein A3K63_01620 [Candidatus Micrarchaeota archaeon RBG_16_49_10]|nr:MAG: hypothetical protein A3K63_01620 [Candidatus Micrarchaeota archaeon RBG_16_49_10]